MYKYGTIVMARSYELQDMCTHKHNELEMFIKVLYICFINRCESYINHAKEVCKWICISSYIYFYAEDWSEHEHGNI
jgi:hypothetical protein